MDTNYAGMHVEQAILEGLQAQRLRRELPRKKQEIRVESPTRLRALATVLTGLMAVAVKLWNR